jgi:hypothetical protein
MERQLLDPLTLALAQVNLTSGLRRQLLNLLLLLGLQLVRIGLGLARHCQQHFDHPRIMGHFSSAVHLPRPLAHSGKLALRPKGLGFARAHFRASAPDAGSATPHASAGTWAGCLSARPFMEDDIARAARAKKGSPFLSTEQAAFYLGLSPRKMQAMRGAGTGPRFRRHSRYVRYLAFGL